VISGIESVAYSKDYLLIITQNLESYEREVKNLENLTWRSVDGLLISLSTETKDVSHFQALYEQSLPMVFFDRVTNDIPSHQVITDNIGGAYAATRHLIERGYKRIATITSTPYLSISQERLEGYKKALTEFNLPVHDDYIQYCPHGGMIIEEIETALNNLLQLPEPPDALLTASDRITIGSYSLIQKRGLAIPHTIAVAGFSNFNAPELFNPPLTTVRQNAFEMGRIATELIIQQVESKRPVISFERKVLPTDLIIRSST
jgi:DNA-binding LacI/PurR family transcriptional regulator